MGKWVQDFNFCCFADRFTTCVWKCYNDDVGTKGADVYVLFIEELANEDVAAVINDTNRGRIRKLEARIEDLEALLAEKDETIAKKDKQINELEQKKQALIERENPTP